MCINCNDSLQINLPPAPSGLNGQDGQSAYVYIASADDANGTNFTYPQDPNQEYIAFLSTNTQLNPVTASNFTGLWVKVKGIDGINGINGINGTNGANAGLKYTFASYGIAADPGTGKLSFSGNDVISSAAFYISVTDLFGNNVNSAILESLNSTLTNKAILKIVKVGDESKYVFYKIINAPVILPTFLALGTTHLASNGSTPFAVDDEVYAILIRTGDTGPTGPAGPAGPSTSVGVTVGGAGLTIPACLTGSVSSGSNLNAFLTGLMSYICSNNVGANPTFFQFRGGVTSSLYQVMSSSNQFLFNAGLPGGYTRYVYLKFPDDTTAPNFDASNMLFTDEIQIATGCPSSMSIGVSNLVVSGIHSLGPDINATCVLEIVRVVNPADASTDVIIESSGTFTINTGTTAIDSILPTVVTPLTSVSTGQVYKVRLRSNTGIVGGSGQVLTVTSGTVSNQF